MNQSKSVTKKNFENPDERKDPPLATIEVVKLGDQTFSRYTFQPGWRWTKDVRPIAKTDLCQGLHIGVQVSGMSHVLLENGTEMDLLPGDAFVIPPGHDGWTVGDEPAVSVTIG